jgi:uncharacterized protein YecT (DUF1311 family)
MKTKLLIAYAFIALGLGVTTASAQEAKPDCPDAESTLDMSECLTGLYRKADANLNEVWSLVLAAIKVRAAPAASEDWIAELRATQRHWIAFRDADCLEVTAREWEGGTGAGLAVVGCLLTHTRDRASDLRERYLDGF